MEIYTNKTNSYSSIRVEDFLCSVICLTSHNVKRLLESECKPRIINSCCL